MMPPRNTMADKVACAAGKSLRVACSRVFSSVALAEISNVISGGTPDTGNPDLWNGDVVWITPKDLGKPRAIEIDSSERRITDVALRESAARLLPIGAILLSSRAPIGHLAIAARPLATNQGFKNIVPSERLDSRYCFHLLRGSIEDFVSQGRGNTFLEIPARVVLEFRLPLPPLPVQGAVAKFLDVLYQRLSGSLAEMPDLPGELMPQQALIARLEELATLERLHAEIAIELDALLPSILDRASKGEL